MRVYFLGGLVKIWKPLWNICMLSKKFTLSYDILLEVFWVKNFDTWNNHFTKTKAFGVKRLAVGERFWESTAHNLSLPICTTPNAFLPKVVKLCSCPRAYKWKCGQRGQSQMKSDDSSRDTQLRCTNVKPWMFSGNFALSKRVTLRKITKFSQFWLTHLFHLVA